MMEEEEILVVPDMDLEWDPSDSDKGHFPCGLCSYVAKLKTNLATHMKTHEKGYPLFYCDSCPYVASNTWQLSRHKNSVHGQLLGHGMPGGRRNSTSLYSNSSSSYERQSYGEDEEISWGETYEEGEEEESDFAPVIVKVEGLGGISHTTGLGHASRGQDLRHHPVMKRVKTNAKYQCPECFKTFRHPNSVTYHRKSHRIYKPYKCDLCSYRAQQAVSLRLHKLSHAKERDLLQCQFCDYTITTQRGLTQHVAEEHKDESLVAGSQPDSPFQKTANVMAQREQRSILPKPALAPHINITNTAGIKIGPQHTQEEDHQLSSQQKGPFSCPYCNKNFVARIHMEAHVRTHTGEKPFHCSHCSYASAQRSNLISHMKKHHEAEADNEYEEVVRRPEKARLNYCSLCNYSTRSPSMLNAHKLIMHPNSRLFIEDSNEPPPSPVPEITVQTSLLKTCPTCSEEFSEMLEYINHLKMHEDLGNSASPQSSNSSSGGLLKCAKCNFTSKLQIALNKHMKKHEVEQVSVGVTELEVEDCGGEPDLDPLAFLEVKHDYADDDSDPRLVCALCQQTFSKEHLLDAHMRTHAVPSHKVLPRPPAPSFNGGAQVSSVVRCNRCPERFQNYNDFEDHFQRAHGVDRSHKCHICRHATGSSSNLKTHLKSHKNPIIYQCRLCEFSGSNRTTLIIHLNDNHYGVSGKKANNYVDAVQVRNPMFFGSSMESSSASSSSSAPLPQSNNSNSDLLQQLHQGAALVYVEDDDFGRSPTDMEDNNVVPSGDEEEVEWETTEYDGQQLQGHSNNLTFLPEEPQSLFHCQKCPRVFEASVQLKEHLAVYHGEARYKCDYCSYTSKYRQCWEVHTRTHTGEKPYACDLCAFASASFAGLYAHTKSAHKKKLQKH